MMLDKTNKLLYSYFAMKQNNSNFKIKNALRVFSGSRSFVPDGNPKGVFSFKVML